MKFASIAAACLLSVSAKNNNLANQLVSLKSMVKATGEWDTNNMISSISARKVELEDALEAGTMSKAEVASELKYLLQLVRDVESNNKAHAVTTLTARKASLVNLEGDDATTEGDDANEGDDAEAGDGDNTETPAAEGDDAEEEEKEGYWAAYEGGIEKIEAEVAARKTRVESAQAAVDALTDDSTDAEKEAANKELENAKASLDRAEKGLEMAKKAGPGGMIAIVVVALVVVVGGCYCYRKNSSENEGGAKEDKKLFKKVFKGKTQKKATKEEIIPTFAVPAEEQI